MDCYNIKRANANTPPISSENSSDFSDSQQEPDFAPAYFGESPKDQRLNSIK